MPFQFVPHSVSQQRWDLLDIVAVKWRCGFLASNYFNGSPRGWGILSRISLKSRVSDPNLEKLKHWLFRSETNDRACKSVSQSLSHFVTL